MALLSRKRNTPPTSEDAKLLRSAVVWMLKNWDNAPTQRVARVVQRLERFPVPSGLIRELRVIHQQARPVASRPGGSGPSPKEVRMTRRAGEILRLLGLVMQDVALPDRSLETELERFSRDVPRAITSLAMNQLQARAAGLRDTGRLARRKELARRNEIKKLVAGLMRELGRAADLGSRVDESVSRVEALLEQDLDPDGFRQLRQQLTRQVGQLASDSRSMREELQQARHRADSLEDLAAKQAEQIVDLTAEASKDPLTDVANRRAFDLFMEQTLPRCRTSDTPFSLLLLDLDNFKRVNDTWGHPFGDEVLVAVASTLSSAVRQEDVVARVGGEEFAVLLVGAPPDVAERVARRLLEQVSSTEHKNDVRVTASGGLANLRQDDNPKSLYRRADAALYEAKRGGRDQLKLEKALRRPRRPRGIQYDS